MRRVEEVGPGAPEVLQARRAAVVGCGALGSAAASLLVRAGVGWLRLIDRDVVEAGNLGDQCLYVESDALERLPKAEVAAARLSAVGGGVVVEGCVADVGADNVGELVAGVDVIVDCSDNLETKYLLNDVAVSTGTPWVYAGCAGAFGTVFAVVPGRTPCLRCVWRDPPAAGLVEGCETRGLLVTTAAMVAAMQVTEALKVLLGRVDELLGAVTTLDTWTARVRRIPGSFDVADDDCPACARQEFSFLDGDGGVPGLPRAEALCGDGTVLIRSDRAWFDYETVRARLADGGELRVSTPAYFSLDVDGCRLMVYRSGRALLHGTDDVARARALFGRYVVA